MKPPETIIDLSDVSAKRSLLTKLGALSGRWCMTMRPYKPRRSLKANVYYHAAVIPTFKRFMQNHGQFFEAEEVHEFFLQKFASRNVVDPITGEVLSVLGRRSSKMDSTQFSEFVNACIDWMQDRFGIVVPEPETAAVH